MGGGGGEGRGWPWLLLGRKKSFLMFYTYFYFLKYHLFHLDLSFINFFFSSSSCLRSRTSFVVADKKKAILYAWHGCQSHSTVKTLAVNATKRLKKW